MRPCAELALDIITDRVVGMTTHTTEFGLVMGCVSNGKYLEVSESADGRLKVVLRNHYNGKLIAKKVFRNCETQHHDSERWLNDIVGYPNDFAGLLSARGWDK